MGVPMDSVGLNWCEMISVSVSGHEMAIVCVCIASVSVSWPQ